MSEDDRPKWVMPDWMRPYEPLFQNTGGCTVEDLYNCPTEMTKPNIILAAMVVSVESQITLLIRMHARGMLKEVS